MSIPRSLTRIASAVLIVSALFGSSLQVAGARQGSVPAPAKVKKTANLIKNPGAESGNGSSNGSVVHIPNWTTTGATAVKYGASGGFPTAQTPGPTKRGTNFFAGGPHVAEDVESIMQTVALGTYATKIDAGKVKFTIAAWLGGSGSEDDSATVYLTFYSGSHAYLSGAAIGPVTNADRNNVTKFLSRSKTTTVPATARTVDIDVEFDGVIGTYNNAYVDNLSLILTGV